MPMTNQLNIVCGADIHQRFLVATILCRDGRTWANRFLMNLNGLIDFKSWLVSHGCQKVAVESTGGSVDCTPDSRHLVKQRYLRQTPLRTVLEIYSQGLNAASSCCTPSQ